MSFELTFELGMLFSFQRPTELLPFVAGAFCFGPVSEGGGFYSDSIRRQESFSKTFC